MARPDIFGVYMLARKMWQHRGLDVDTASQTES